MCNQVQKPNISNNAHFQTTWGRSEHICTSTNVVWTYSHERENGRGQFLNEKNFINPLIVDPFGWRNFGFTIIYLDQTNAELGFNKLDWYLNFSFRHSQDGMKWVFYGLETLLHAKKCFIRKFYIAYCWYNTSRAITAAKSNL